MAKIIYIAGLGHSGSTILDMALGSLPDCIGLGEIKTLLDPESRQNHMKSTCSCGKPARECEVWSKAEQLLDASQSLEESYDRLLTFLHTKYGESTILVDSSKNSYSYLKHLARNHELKVIYLTRDIRSWAYSRSLSTKKPIIYFIFRWWAENLKVRNSLKKMGIPVIYAGYEELSLYPEHVLKTLIKSLGMEYSPDVLSPGKSKSHIISGNVARVDPLKRKQWTYDARWLLSRRTQVLGLLFNIFGGMNRRLVYSNLHEGRKSSFYLFGTERKQELSEKHN